MYKHWKNEMENIFSAINLRLCYALVNVNCQGPPPAWATQGILMVYLTHTRESDSLILTHSRDIWPKHFNPGEFWPQFEKIVAYFFSLFHLLHVNPHQRGGGGPGNSHWLVHYWYIVTNWVKKIVTKSKQAHACLKCDWTRMGCRHLIGSVVGVYIPDLLKNCYFKIKCWVQHPLCVQLKNGLYLSKWPVCWISLLSRYLSFTSFWVALKYMYLCMYFSFKYFALWIQLYILIHAFFSIKIAFIFIPDVLHSFLILH